MSAIAGEQPILTTPRRIETEYGVSKATVHNLVRRGHLQAVTLPGCRRTWIRRADFESLLQPASAA